MRIISSIVLVCAAAAANGEDWYPSEHGAGDTLGAINHLSPEKVVEAAKLVRTGKTYAPGVVTGWETPAYPPRHYAITIMQPGQDVGPTLGANLATGNDDLLYTWMGIGSQIDGLGHMGINHVYCLSLVKQMAIHRFHSNLSPAHFCTEAHKPLLWIRALPSRARSSAAEVLCGFVKSHARSVTTDPPSAPSLRLWDQETSFRPQSAVPAKP